jgi:very-short-patch-repair endonuclease
MNMDDFTKITEDIVYSDERLKNKEGLPVCDWVRTMLIGDIISHEMTIEDSLIKCESPIEQALAIEMASKDFCNFTYFHAGRIDVIAVENQTEIDACGNKYRPDFLIPVVYKTKDREVYKTFIVECDGHDYHEKTKKQIMKNNKRERDFKAAGYEVIRFSGSEIFESPHKCVRDLMRIIVETYFQLLNLMEP